MKQKHWYDYLWIASAAYLILGFFNILFAWLGLLCFFIPLIIALASGTKGYCNRYCGRGQLFSLLGGRFGLSRKKDIPAWMKSKVFRYGFLLFFLVMFLQMLLNTWLVFAGERTLRQTVTLLWQLQASLALDLPRHPPESRNRSVCLRILRHHAHLHRSGTGDHDSV